MPFLPPNQQCQSTEGNCMNYYYFTSAVVTAEFDQLTASSLASCRIVRPSSDRSVDKSSLGGPWSEVSTVRLLTLSALTWQQETNSTRWDAVMKVTENISMNWPILMVVLFAQSRGWLAARGRWFIRWQRRWRCSCNRRRRLNDAVSTEVSLVHSSCTIDVTDVWQKR